EEEEEGESGTANYESLPPETAPVINALTPDKTYKIIVTATLKEYKSNTWAAALDSDNNPVTETRTKLFRTGNRVLARVSKDSKATKNSNTRNSSSSKPTKPTFKTNTFKKRKNTSFNKQIHTKNVKTKEKQRTKKSKFQAKEVKNKI
ncbi:MAG: hypothetical protein COB98_07105, partial [Flavobacteriaceae bacterium]